MGLIDKILGKRRARKADKAADKGKNMPGGPGEASRGWLFSRKVDKKVDDKREKK